MAVVMAAGSKAVSGYARVVLRQRLGLLFGSTNWVYSKGGKTVDSSDSRSKRVA